MVNSINNPFEQLNGVNTAKNSNEKKTGELGQDEFMTLMLAQMKHQDPMNPMENGDFIAQLAQFRTVTGIDQLNSSFNGFSQTMQSTQALQASSLVGREVLVPGSWGTLAPGGTLNGSVELPASSNDVGLNIYNQSGSLIAQVNMGAHPAGQASFSWDGRMSDGSSLPPGNYQIVANALIDGQREAMPTYVGARVESVSLNAGREPVLNLANVGPMAFSQVREIR
ncbi:MAG: flagellar hook assembly protein FlgD [Thiohalomonadaceae bacterium]